MSDIGLLGGTFDPFHSGHLEIAEAALDSGKLSRVIIMPANVSPFKQGREMAPDEDRLEMARIAASGNDRISVSTLEIDHEDVSYTHRTLTRLRETDPENDYWLIVGSDQFLALESWYKGKDILRDFSVMLAPRPGFDEKLHEDCIKVYKERYGTDIRVIENELIDVSSTLIKERIKEGKSITGMVPEGIEDYINEHGLYR